MVVGHPSHSERARPMNQTPCGGMAGGQRDFHYRMALGLRVLRAAPTVEGEEEELKRRGVHVAFVFRPVGSHRALAVQQRLEET